MPPAGDRLKSRREIVGLGSRAPRAFRGRFETGHPGLKSGAAKSMYLSQKSPLRGLSRNSRSRGNREARGSPASGGAFCLLPIHHIAAI